MRFFMGLAAGVAIVMASLVLTSRADAAKVGPGGGGSKNAPSQPVSFARADLSRGTAAGVARSGGALVLANTGLSAGTYTDLFGYGDIAYESGSWTSDPTTLAFGFDELVTSWNATTLAGTWIRVEMQATGSGRRTKWYVMGTWASGDGELPRPSPPPPGD